jgi:hypothetical protein
MATEAQYLLEFNNLRNQPFWAGFSNDQLRSIVANAMIANMKTEAEYITEFNNLRSQPFWSGFSNEQLRSVLATAMVAGNGATSTIGDCKSGLQTADHSGWVLLDGRAKSSLTASQQTAATSLGIGTNLPNATGRAFVQGTLGAQIGSSTIAQANLPNVTLNAASISAGTPAGSIDSQGAHTHPATVIFHDATGGGFNGGRIQSTDRNPVRTQTNASEVQIQSAGSHAHNFTGATLSAHSHTVPLGGTGAAYTPAGIGCNMFLFLAS